MTGSAALDLVPPAYLWVPEYETTLGPEVAEVATLAGFPPDPEQRMLLDATFAIDPVHDRTLCRDVGCCAPRQNLKTGFLKQCALGWLYVLELPLTVWSAHEFSTSQEAFRDMCILIESSPDLDAEVKQIHKGNGEEAIELTGNRRLKFKARTLTGGRGLTGHRIVLDEAMYLNATQMGALIPTLRAVPDAQVVLAGSAGMATAAVWRGYRNRGRAGGAPRFAWAEWTDVDAWTGCERPDCDHFWYRPGCALDDRRRWRATNSALGRRINEESLENDRTVAFETTPLEFARETLGWWEDPPSGGGIIDVDLWAQLAQKVGAPASPVWSLEVTLDRGRSVIGAAWQVGSRKQVELVEDRGGVDWVVDRLKVLRRKYNAHVIAVELGTEAATFIEDFEAAGFEVIRVASADRPVACARFFDMAESGELSHDGDPAITDALKAARWKDVGEGARVFSRRKSESDIAALYAVTNALHGLAVGPVYDLGSSIH